MILSTKSLSVLALETSCDESAASVITNEGENIKILSNLVSSQIAEHAKWGGVVPEIASRIHLEAMPFLIRESIALSGKSISEIDAIAATVAPGLAGSLLMGSIAARSLCALHSKPFLGVHHLEGHLASVFLSDKRPNFPYIVLLVSGGHTELIKVDSYNNFHRVGRSHDDAAGEAFDKVARLMGLPYPGGPEIERCGKSGDPFRFLLPKGKVSNPKGGFYPYDFSFSGLKTAMLRKIQSLESKHNKLPVEDLSASFENIVAEVLVERSIKCACDYGIEDLVMVGGVAANSRLRKMMIEKALENSIKTHLAPLPYCTDNAAMIGTAALIRLKSSNKVSSLQLGVSGRLKLEEANLLYEEYPPF